MKYQVITLCGSLKFINDFVRIQIMLERKGHVCFSVTAGEENIPPTDAEKSILDKVHYKKIMLSDCILVIDTDGYIGHSTKNEIEFAKLTNKPVFYKSNDLSRFV